MSVSEVSTLIGDSALKEWAKTLGVGTARTAIKATALAVGHEPPGPRDDVGLGLVAFQAHPELQGDGFQSYLVAPKVYQDAPELFFGPFLQLGTYLKESGVIDSEALRWGLDLALDPLNLAEWGAGGLIAKAFGGSGLTALGKAQRLVGVLAEGRVGIKGAEVIDKARAALEVAGRVAGSEAEIIKAAQAGEKGAIKAVLHGVLGKDIPEEYRTVIEALGRDRDALGRVLEGAEGLKDYTLKAEDVLQDTLRGRIEQGAVRPFLRVARPLSANPFRQPLTFARQAAGFYSHNDTLWFAVGANVAPGLEKALPKAFLVHGAAKLAEEASLKGVYEAEAAFRAPKLFRPRISSWQASVANEALLAATSAPNAKLYQTLGYESVDDKVLTAAYRELRGISTQTDIDPDLFAKFKDDVLGDMNGARAAVDKAATAQQDAIVQSMVGKIESVAGQAVRAGTLDKAQVDALTAQARRIFNTLRRVDTLKAESVGLGSALAARANLGTLLAHVSNVNYREIIDGAYRGAGARESIREVVGYYAAHPEFWDDSGKLIATREEMDKAGAHFFGDLLDRSHQIPSMAFLETHLRAEGLNPEVLAIARQMESALQGVGKNLMAEGVLEGMIHDYFPRVLHFTDEGLKEFKLLHSQTGEWLEGQLTGKVTDDRITAILEGSGARELLEKYRAGKLSFEEARKLPEKLARGFEERGWATYERDNVAVYSAYMDSANKALLWNRIASNPEALAPVVTVNWIRDNMGEKAAHGLSDEYLTKMGVKHIMSTDGVPAKVRHLFTEITGRPRTGTLSDYPEQLLKASAVGVTDKDLARVAQQSFLAGLDGKTKLALTTSGKAYDLRLVDKAGKAMKFDPAWHTTGKYPEKLKNRMAVKEAVRQAVGEAVDRASIRGEEMLGEALAKGGERKAATISALHPHFGHLSDAFALVKKGQINNQFTRFMDRWNYRLKSMVLLGDVFHYNVLAFSQFAANPTDALKYLYNEAGRLLPGVADGGFVNAVQNSPALKHAAIGALAGGAMGATRENSDTEDIIAFSLAGAFYGATVAAAKINAREGFAKLVQPDQMDTLLWMGLGGWSGRPDDRAIGVVQRSLKTIRNNLARDPKGAGAVMSVIEGALHVSDGWDRQLWDVLQNGSKHHYFATRWEREVPKLEASAAYKAADEAGQHNLKVDLAKQLVQAGNNAFGGQTWRYMLDRPEVQHTLRYILLSPDWTASRLQGAANIFLNQNLPQRVALGAALGTATDFIQYGGDEKAPRWRGPILGGLMGAGLGAWANQVAKRMTTKGDVLARESRALWTKALAMGYLTMEAANLALSGHHMWENAEGKKTSIDLGDGSYLSLGKPWVEPLEFAGIYHAEKYPIPIASRLRSKGAPLPIAAVNILTNTDGFGPLITVEDSFPSVAYKLAAFSVDLAAPIITQGPARLAGEVLTGRTDPASLQRAALRFGGFTTTTIPNQIQADLQGLGLPPAAIQPRSLGNPVTLFGGRL